MKSLVPQKSGRAGSRSLQVTRAYLHAGNSVGRFLWIRVGSGNPVLKLVAAPLLAVLMLVTLLSVILMLGFALLALSVLWALSKEKRDEPQGS